MKYTKLKKVLILLISTQKLYFSDGDAIYDVLMQVSVFDFITTDIKFTMIHLLNYQAFRHTQPFSFSDKLTGPILPFVVLAL